MKGKMQRIVAMILVFCLTLSLDSVIAMAEETEEVMLEAISKSEGNPSELKEMSAEIYEDAQNGWSGASDVSSVHRFDETKRITKNDVPISIGYEEAKERGHRERRYDLEGDNPYKVVFDNDDDTRTEYYFDYPVKYTDKQGNVRDVKMELTRCNEGYRTAENSIVTTFSDKLEKGVHLSDEEVNIRLIPEFVESADAQIDTTGEIVTYEIDDVTKIEYSLTYLGFKEDIVVSEYNGVTEYDFLLYTGGLKLQRIQEEWFLVDAAGTVQASVGDLIIFTADEKNNTLGEIYVETITRGELYRMTLVIDEEYLRSPETKYPIRIDPTIEVNYDNDGAGAIEDVTINSGMGSLGTSGSIFIGKRTSGGIARTLMRFPGLDMSGIRSASQIQSATVEIRDLMCESASMVVNCHVFTGNTWTEGTATWSNTSPNSYQSTVLSSNTISYANGQKQATVHRYSFDITDAVIGWKLGNYNINKGILFKASSSTESSSSQLYKTFASYNRASYKPSLSITYNMTGGAYEGTYYLNNEETGRYLGNSGTSASQYRGLLSTLGNKVRWAIHEVEDYYVIQPSTNSSLYLCSVGTNMTTVALRAVTDGIIPTNCRWDIEYAGQYKTYLKNVGTGRYLADDNGIKAVNASSKDVWRTVTTSYYGSGSSYVRRELTSTDAIFNNLTVDVNSKEISTNSTATKILWSTPSDFTYTTSGEGATVNGTTVTGCAGGGNVTVTATHKVTGLKKTFTVKAYNTAIVVVPGICGSDLMHEDGAPFWDISRIEELGGNLDTGKLVLDLLYPGLISIVPVENTYGFDDTYKNIIDALRQKYEERCDILFCAYDWRLSNEENAVRFKTEISDRYEKMIIISHSMGGILTSSYLATGATARQKVKQAFFVGTPFLGAPLASYLMAGGEVSEFYELDETASKIASNFAPGVLGYMDSVYELLPTEKCAELGIACKQYLGEDSYDDMGILLDSLFARMSLPSPNKRLKNAKNIHKGLWESSNQHVTSLVDSYYIAGTGIDTLCGYDYLGVDVKRTQSGDSIVPLWSATINNMYANRTTIYGEVSHVNLITDTDVISDICRMIEGGN